MKRKTIQWVAFAMVFIGLPIQIRYPDEPFSLSLIVVGCLITFILFLFKVLNMFKKDIKR